jgi:hypothetical protein
MVEVSVHRELVNECVTAVMSEPALWVPADADLLPSLGGDVSSWTTACCGYQWKRQVCRRHR